MSEVWRVLTPEEVAALDASPEQIAWHEYQRRSQANARLHCGCGRFVKPGKLESYYNGQHTISYTPWVCTNCGPGRTDWT